MASVINFADAAALIKMIEEGNVAVSGMTTAEAVAALGAQETGKAVAYNVITTAEGQIIQLTGQTATAAFEAFEAADGVVTAAGAASEASSVATANMTVIESSGATGVGALLTTSLPVWTAAVAPVLGVALGAELYQENPTLWTKISQTLLPFCYEDTETIPWTAVWDSILQKYNIYAEGDAVDALKDVLEDEINFEEEVERPSSGYTDIVFPIPLNTRVTLLHNDNHTYVWYADSSDARIIFNASTNGALLFASPTPTNYYRYDVTAGSMSNNGPVSMSYTISGKTVYFYITQTTVITNTVSIISGTPYSQYQSDIRRYQCYWYLPRRYFCLARYPNR